MSEASGEGKDPSSGTMLTHRATFSRKGRRNNVMAVLDTAISCQRQMRGSWPAHDGIGKIPLDNIPIVVYLVSHPVP